MKIINSINEEFEKQNELFFNYDQLEYFFEQIEEPIKNDLQMNAFSL